MLEVQTILQKVDVAREWLLISKKKVRIVMRLDENTNNNWL